MTIQLLQLPDEVLLKILSFLTAQDLYNLSSLQPRLREIVGDKSLWVNVDLGQKSLRPQSLRNFIKYLGPHTLHLCVTGHVKSHIVKNPKKEHYLPEAFLLSLKRRCRNLVALSLHKCYINYNTTNFSCLPRSLRKLSLAGSVFTNLPQPGTKFSASPFFRLEKNLPLLNEIGLQKCCSWLRLSDIALIKANCPNVFIMSG